ncbi:leucine--tRNA ligase [Thalassospira lucentensis]|uniref:leucine--tRNA ligase n=1 Tax=Thalassospira lucentensis TaxID=168935 RepID=UPI003D2E9D3F
MANYQDSAREFEKRWQDYWRENDTYRTPNPGDADFDAAKKKSVILDMFPYPSGVGLHIGHPLGYIGTDVKARFERMRGYNVLHSMGFDAFGLPAEQFAIQTGQHPRITTEANIENMLRQLQVIGLGHDPHRRFATTDVDYYKWTQWIFLQLFNSFYDPTVEWKGPQGQTINGRARPIAELRPLLESGEWVLDEDGVPQPKAVIGDGTKAEGKEIDRAIDRGRLAYVDEVPVNWCPMLGTVLSNEEVTNEGKSERGDYPVYKRPLKQWMLRITDYADRLVADLEGLDWPNGVVEMQKGWIGRSVGARMNFPVKLANGSDDKIAVYTTRPDTIFGATYMVLAPEHPLVDKLASDDKKADIAAYRAQASELKAVSAKDDAEREKTGVFIGAHATNPVTGEDIPVWIADYVLMGYGTGAIMAVPAGDQRDFEFAHKFDLPIRATTKPSDGWLKDNAPADAADLDLAALHARYIEAPGSFKLAQTDIGETINSATGEVSLDGLSTPDAKAKIIEWMEGKGIGRGRVQYKLRDWLFSRQRYWGEPFPVLFDQETGQVHGIAQAALPVVLPEMTDFKPVSNEDPNSEPQPPLARAKEWMAVAGIVLEDGSVLPVTAEIGSTHSHGGVDYEVRAFKRDANSMPNWAGSCWYYLRYFDAKNNANFASEAAADYWAKSTDANGKALPGAVDLYVGGAEHAVLHLLYSRFWHKVLFDLGHVGTPEPFQKLFNQGMITADAYSDSRGVYVDIHDVEMRDVEGKKQPFNAKTNEALITVPGKMGKRYKNGIPPEEICDQYTIDTFRTYEMYMGPLDSSKPWQSDAIVGMMRFLSNVWKVTTQMERTDHVDGKIETQLHKTIAKVTGDIADLRLNTAIAALIELTNALTKQNAVHDDHARALALMVAPFAPHLGEELMSRMASDEFGVKKSVIKFDWPEFDAEKAKDDEFEVPVQINGKKRASVMVAAGADQATVETLAKADENIARHLEGKEIVKVIYIAKPTPKLLNIVVKG